MSTLVNALTKADRGPKQELAILKIRIAQYDGGFRRAYSEQMNLAFLAGVAINRAKEILPHGKFIPWIEGEAKLNRMSANRYARLADLLIDSHPALKCNTAVLHLTDSSGDVSDLSQEDQKELISALHEIADGKTLTELYRDLGVIRPPKKQKHHPKKITPEEEAESARMLANERINKITGDILQLLHEWREYSGDPGSPTPAIALSDAKSLRDLDGARIDLGKVIKSITKKSRKGKGGAK